MHSSILQKCFEICLGEGTYLASHYGMAGHDWLSICKKSKTFIDSF